MGIQSLERAMDILELFLEERSLRAVEIARRVGLHINTTRNLLQTLEERGYLCRVAPFRYGLGCQCRVLGDRCAIWDDLKEVATPFLMELARELGNNIFLGGEKNGKLFCIGQCAGTGAILTSEGQLWTEQLHCTASGKILLAYGKERVWDTLGKKRSLQKLTEKTITSLKALKKKCAEIAKTGWVLSCDESINGVSSLAVGIFNGNHEIIAALGESFPSFFIQKADIDIAMHTRKLLDTAIRISANYNALDSSFL